MQVLLRNPLAEPYILGSSGGAAVAALVAIIAGLGSTMVDLAAFGGAMAATLLVFSVAQGSGSWTPTRLLLTGVVLAAGFSAATTMLLALTPDRNLRGMLFWLMGDLSFAYQPVRLLLLLAGTTLSCWLASRHLNVLARGDLQAAIVGLPVATWRMGIFAVTALVTAISVTSVGVIGFVGLVIPHLIRLLAGSDHRSRVACIGSCRRHVTGHRRHAVADTAGPKTASGGRSHRFAGCPAVPDPDEPESAQPVDIALRRGHFQGYRALSARSIAS